MEALMHRDSAHRERQLGKQENKEMDKDFFKYLPSEIVFDIFSKLPIRSIGICRFVCKSWLNLVGTHEFAKFHLSRSAPCLVIDNTSNKKGSCKIFEINDDLDLERHELHYRLSTEFVFPHYYATLQGSANGLLLFRRWNYGGYRLYICNPITRDYIKLPKVCGNGTVSTYGFGVSKMSGQHKVVRIFHGYSWSDKSGCRRATKPECLVYTLGTRSWRSIAASSGNPLNYEDTNAGAVFVNGNLYWLVTDEVNHTVLISCFDLEAEAFSTFPPPRHEEYLGRLCVVGNWLCFCGRIDGVMSIWLAKEEKCWTKEFVITSSIICRACIMYPIKVFKDGDILIAPFMSVYSTKTTKTTQKLGVFGLINLGEAIIYTPSFLSLKSFGMETAISF